MAFTVEFYVNGERVKAFDNDVLDEDKARAIIKLRVHDTIALGTGNEKKNYRVLKIHRRFNAASLSGQAEDNMHFDCVVEAIPD